MTIPPVGPPARTYRRGGPIGLVWRSWRRRWWRSWAALALLTAVVGGFTLAATAAGRRTSSAYPDFVSRYGFDVAAFAARPLPALTSLREVSSAVPTANPQSGQPRCRCRAVIPANQFTVLVLPSRGSLPMKLLSGRMPAAGRPDEAVVSQPAQHILGVGVGAEVTVPFYGVDQASILGGDGPPPPPSGPVVTFHVVGIEISEGEYSAGSTPSFNLYASAAFASRYGERTTNAYLYAVRLHGGQSSLARFERDANNLSNQGFIGYLSPDVDNQAVQASIHPQAMGWWFLALLSGLAGLVVLIQALARQARAESAAYPTLSALGFTRSQLVRVETLRNAVIGLLGAGGALVIAYLLSPLAPVGEARVAEPYTGWHFDAAVLLPGALAVAAVTLGVGVIPSLISRRHPSRTGESDILRVSPVVDRMAGLGLPPSATVGVRNALITGSGRDSVPARTALLGTVLAVTALCATQVFSASLRHLIASPRLYGDLYQLNFNSGGQPDQALVRRLRQDPLVTAVNQGFPAELKIRSNVVGAAAVRSLRGPILFAIRSGRLARGPGEIDLGSVSLRRAGARLGSTVPVTFARPQSGEVTVPMRVVGVVVLPTLGNTVDLGTGAFMTVAAFEAAVCSAPAPGGCTSAVGANRDGGLLASFANSAAGRADLSGYLRDYPDFATRPVTPSGLVNFGEAVNFPLIFGALIALFGISTLVHMLATSVARRRRDIRLLKALGFLNRQIAAILGWQATTMAVVGVALGLPLGIAMGRLAWTIFAANLGVVTVIRLPGWPLAVLILTVVAVAEALAVPAAVAAARQRSGRLPDQA